MAWREHLINTFAESDQTGSGPNLPGLFTTPGATSLPTSTTGACRPDFGECQRRPNARAATPYCCGMAASRATPTTPITQAETQATRARLSQLLGNLSATQTFSAASGITTSASLSSYASASVGWLEGQHSNVSSQSTYSKHVAQYGNDSLVQCDRCQYRQ